MCGIHLSADRSAINSGVTAYEWNQKGVKRSHNEDTRYDGRNSKRQRFGFH
jgi:hypothetical protein